MKSKIALLSLVAFFAVFVMSTSAFAWSHSGTVTQIEKWASGTIFIEVTNSTPTAVKKAIDGSLSADHKKELLAMFLTAQSSGQDVTIFIVDGKIVSLTMP